MVRRAKSSRSSSVRRASAGATLVSREAFCVLTGVRTRALGLWGHQ
jgi:hypothetical protein